MEKLNRRNPLSVMFWTIVIIIVSIYGIRQSTGTIYFYFYIIALLSSIAHIVITIKKCKNGIQHVLWNDSDIIFEYKDKKERVEMSNISKVEKKLSKGNYILHMKNGKNISIDLSQFNYVIVTKIIENAIKR